ncbi:MAG: GntR family transcriptional regulator [Bacilli bacterium]
MNIIFDNTKSIHSQLVHHLVLLIISGKYKSSDRLPSVRDLALTFGVNPNTMQKALVELENMKLIFTQRTNGKFVTANEKKLKKF